MAKKILMVVTGHDRIDDLHPTGVWFEEFAVPYAQFRREGYEVTVASPAGGEVPIDPRSLEAYEANADNSAAREVLKHVGALEARIKAEAFDAVFIPGGHGAMYDLPGDREVQRLIREFYDQAKITAAVCHGPAALVDVTVEGQTPLVRGRRLTAFTDAEERAVGLDTLMPFLLESRLRERGAEFIAAPNWQDNVVVDGHLVTGQNPQSSASAASAVVQLLST